VGDEYAPASARKAKERLKFIRDRFPQRSEVLTVLGVAVFVCHSWSMLVFFNRLSAFILYFRIAEIAEVFAFLMAFALLESLLVVGGLTLLSVILPSKWLRDGFAYKSFIIIVIATIAAIILQKNWKGVLPPPYILALYWLRPLLLTVGIISAVQMMPRARNILINLADRVSIMLFLYVPIGLLSLIVVALRNLL